MAENATRDITAFLRQRVVPPGGSRHGLVVGIEQYRDTRLNLRCAAADAKAIHGLMTDPDCGMFPKDNVQLLLNEDATREGIWRALSALRRSAGESDTVWVYYAGHAAPEESSLYWVTYDTDVDDLYGTGLSNDQISKALNDIRAGRLLVLLDCCHAAATAAQKNPTRAVLTAEEVFACYKGKGRITVSASDGKEKSVELGEVGHGAFTYFLEKGLRGEADADGDGVVTADELWQYLHAKVTDASQKAGNRQTPMLTGEMTHELALTLNPIATKHKRRLAEAVMSSVGFGEDRLATQEAELCLELLRHSPRTESEADILTELTAFAEGRTGITTFRRLIRSFHDSRRRVDLSEGTAGAGSPAVQSDAGPSPSPTLAVVSCPHCGRRFDVQPEAAAKASRFRCSACGKIFSTATSPPRLLAQSSMTLDEAMANVSTTEAREFLKKQTEEWKDWAYFLREMLLVLWRMGNGLQGAAMSMQEQLGTISDSDNGEQVSSKVFQALHGVQVAPFNDMVATCSRNIADTIAGLVQEMPSDITTRYPRLEVWGRGFAVSEKARTALATKLAVGLEGLRPDYDKILGYYRQLVDSFPRFQQIKTRSWWASFLAGGGLGYVAGPVGVLGAVLWDGWKNKSDNEFMDFYGNAIDDFISSCVDLSSRGEPIVADQFGLVETMCDAGYNRLRAMYVALARQGVDLVALEKAVEKDQRKTFAQESEWREVFEVILANLKQDAHVPRPSLRNIEKSLEEMGIRTR